MNRLIIAIAAATGIALLGGCVAPVGPVEVTRFHEPTAALAQGPIAIVPAPGGDAEGLEFRSYAAAVGRELARIGYVERAGDTTTPQIAELRVDRRTVQPDRARSPVSVGVGGSTGSYGSGVGVGIGLDLSGPPPEQTRTEMAVMIRDRATGKSLWEGRASFTVKASSPLAQTQLGAAKMAAALFRDFPGRSGETIEVR